jgi:hypothetical protein
MEVDLQQIRQKKIKSFLLRNGLATLNGLAGMKPICFCEASAATYRKHFQSFLIESDIALVWETYATIHPRDAWNGKMVGFGIQYARAGNKIQYLDSAYSGMEQGQIIILQLSLLWGLVKIAVAHEVAEIDEARKTIKMCYMEGGASEGSQWISLKETPEGFTEVTHLTYYKSKSPFRDKFLYPPLHNRAINEFHGNIRKRVLSLLMP